MSDTKTISVSDASADDVIEIRKVQEITWLNTYPNEELGITAQDIEERFDDTSEEAQKSIEERKRTINKDSSIHTWVAKEEGKIVGFCVVEKKQSTNSIEAIYLLPEYQNKGVGSRLMELALDWLGSDKPIKVHVASYNQKAIEFYRKHGFVQTRKAAEPSVAPLPSGKTIPEVEMIKEF